MKPNRLLGKEEVADRLGISIRTLKRNRERGVPFFAEKAVKQGRVLKWKETDLESYIDSLDYAVA